MRIFMTGGTGFVGSYLSAGLTKLGHSVTVLTRGVMARRSIPEGIVLQAGNPVMPGPWQERVAECDAVINLAGLSIFTLWTPGARREILESRVLTTRHLVDALAMGGRRDQVLLSASAVGYYGGRMDDEILDESAGAGSDFLAQVSMQWENAARKAEEVAGTRVALCRFGVVLGRDGGALARMLPPFRYCLGSPLGNGRQWFSWIHEEDLLRALHFCLTNEKMVGPVNCTAPHPLRNREVTTSLASILGRPAFMPAVPGFILKGLLGAMGDLFLKGQRVIPRKLTEAGFIFRFPTFLEAVSNLVQ